MRTTPDRFSGSLVEQDESEHIVRVVRPEATTDIQVSVRRPRQEPGTPRPVPKLGRCPCVPRTARRRLLVQTGCMRDDRSREAAAIRDAGVRRLGEPAAAGGDRVPARGEPGPRRAVGRTSASADGQATVKSGRQGESTRPEAARRVRGHGHPGHGAAMAPSPRCSDGGRVGRTEARASSDAGSGRPARRSDGRRERLLGLHPKLRRSLEPGHWWRATVPRVRSRERRDESPSAPERAGPPPSLPRGRARAEARRRRSDRGRIR